MTPEQLEKGNEIYAKINEMQSIITEEKENSEQEELCLQNVILGYENLSKNGGYTITPSFSLKKEQLEDVRSLVLSFAKQNLKELEAKLAEL